MWQLQHIVIAINSWRGQISKQVNTICDLGIEETIMHRFWTCPTSLQVQRFILALMNLLAGISYLSLMIVPNWQQALFLNEAMEPFQLLELIQMLIKGVTLWTVWILRNNNIFNHKRWQHSQAINLVWQGLMDYTQITWAKCLKASPAVQGFCPCPGFFG